MKRSVAKATRRDEVFMFMFMFWERGTGNGELIPNLGERWRERIPLKSATDQQHPITAPAHPSPLPSPPCPTLPFAPNSPPKNRPTPLHGRPFARRDSDGCVSKSRKFRSIEGGKGFAGEAGGPHADELIL